MNSQAPGRKSTQLTRQAGGGSALPAVDTSLLFLAWGPGKALPSVGGSRPPLTPSGPALASQGVRLASTPRPYLLSLLPGGKGRLEVALWQATECSKARFPP